MTGFAKRHARSKGAPKGPAEGWEKERPNIMLMNVSACAAWAPGVGDISQLHPWPTGALPPDDGSAPAIPFVDPLLRRRLGRLSRMALHVAHEAAAQETQLSTVFASRHGELSRTVSILHALSVNEAPSPAAFSLSVHNSAAGIFSIARADQSPSTALAAGEETLLWALQDAAIRLVTDPDSAILLVYADEPLPTEYRSFPAPEPAHALAFLMRSGDDIHLDWAANDGNAPSREPLSVAMMAYLLGHRNSFAWHGARLSVHGYSHV